MIDADEKFAMIPHKLKEQIERDILDGYIPTFVCASVGTTNTTAMDPISEIGQICKEYNIWLHVDAAMAGAAALCPEFRYLQEGLEYANSYTFNPHKWMLTNFDCSVLFIDDRDKITSAMSVIPEYLKINSSFLSESFIKKKRVEIKNIKGRISKITEGVFKKDKNNGYKPLAC